MHPRLITLNLYPFPKNIAFYDIYTEIIQTIYVVEILHIYYKNFTINTGIQNPEKIIPEPERKNATDPGSRFTPLFAN
jgi:hypothetical protein